LNQNLLSVLTLTVKHAFRVVIVSNVMEFIKDNIPRFYASVGADLVALLSGSTIVQAEADFTRHIPNDIPTCQTHESSERSEPNPRDNLQPLVIAEKPKETTR
jgi:hypothetical protein